jgi:hypothetical protein
VRDTASPNNYATTNTVQLKIYSIYSIPSLASWWSSLYTDCPNPRLWRVVDPGSTRRVVDPGSTRRVVDPVDTRRVVDPVDTRLAVDPVDTRLAVDPGSTRRVVDPGSTRLAVDPGSTRLAVDPGSTRLAVDPGCNKLKTVMKKYLLTFVYLLKNQRIHDNLWWIRIRICTSHLWIRMRIRIMLFSS